MHAGLAACGLLINIADDVADTCCIDITECVLAELTAVDALQFNAFRYDGQTCPSVLFLYSFMRSIISSSSMGPSGHMQRRQECSMRWRRPASLHRAHDLCDHVFVMADVAVDHAVNAGCRLANGCVIAECVVSESQVIVNGLGCSDDFKAELGQVSCYAQSIIAAHADHSVDLAVFQAGQHLVHLAVLNGVLAFAAQHCAWGVAMGASMALFRLMASLFTMPSQLLRKPVRVCPSLSKRFARK